MTDKREEKMRLLAMCLLDIVQSDADKGMPVAKELMDKARKYYDRMINMAQNNKEYPEGDLL